MGLNTNTMRLWDVALLERILREQYRERFIAHCREELRYASRALSPKWIFMDPQFIVHRRVDIMLNFKNDKGEIVMTENDKGDLNIHDEALKESLKENMSLEEAKKKLEVEEE